jgi:hypothetical protein
MASSFLKKRSWSADCPKAGGRDLPATIQWGESLIFYHSLRRRPMTTSGVTTHHHDDLEKRLQQVEEFVQGKKTKEAQDAKQAQEQRKYEEVERHDAPILGILKVLRALKNESGCKTMEDVKKLKWDQKNTIEMHLDERGVIQSLEKKETGNLDDLIKKYQGQLKGHDTSEWS